MATYSSLKTSTNNWTERNYSDDQLDEFIDNAEAVIRRELMGYQREITTTLTTDANGEVALPADFIGMRSVYYDETPFRYSISGSTLTVEDGASYTFDVVYYGTLDALSDSNPTNWLLDAAPDVYLLLCQAQAKLYEEEYESAAGLESVGLGKLNKLNIQNLVAQYGRQGLQLPVRAQ